MNGVLATNAHYTGDTSHPGPASARVELNPSTNFMHPADVVADQWLTLADKRAILAAWASDVRAVPDAPGLRQLDNGAVVRIDDILQALRSLDEGADTANMVSRVSRPAGRRHGRVATRLKFALRRNRSDDDDEPPPCPAVIMRPRKGPLTGGGSVIPDAVLAA